MSIRHTTKAQRARLDTEIDKYLLGIIEGTGGMNDFERYELAILECSERLGAANWTVRCLANPQSEGADYVLSQIISRRHDKGDKLEWLYKLLVELSEDAA